MYIFHILTEERVMEKINAILIKKIQTLISPVIKQFFLL